MRTFVALAGLAAAASAQLMPSAAIAAMSFPSPKSAPQGKGAVGDVVTYNANGVYSSTYDAVYASAGMKTTRGLRRRHDNGDCSPQPLGAGPVPDPDTPEAFVADTDFSNAALNAQTPSGWVRTFQNLKASTQGPMGYLGYSTMTSYDTATCAARCDSTTGCFAFNVYYERDPTIDPGVNCQNPRSTTIIKCVYWGTTIEPDTATNDGQFCEDFHIVIAGSNGYVRSNPGFTVPNYNGTFIGNAAIDAPTQCDSYITYKLFNDGQPFDPNRCAAACQAETDYNVQYLNSRAICRFFDTYILLKNGVPQGQYCSLYTRSWDSSYATNTGYTFNGDVYTIGYSYIYSNSADPGSQVCDATCKSQSPCPVSSLTVTVTSALSSTTSTTASTSSFTVITTSSSASTTKAVTTSSVASTTASTTKSTTAVLSTTSSSAAVSTTTAQSSTVSTFTTTKAPTTTLQTSTTKSTTTSSSTTAPAATGNCFKIKATGPSWLQNQYLGLDSSSIQKLSYKWSSSNPSVFYIDSVKLLRNADNSYLYRSIPNWFATTSGYIAKLGIFQVSASKNGSNNVLNLSAPWSGTNTIWASQSDSSLQMGTNPAGYGWTSWGSNSASWSQVTLTYEPVSCPAGANAPSANGWSNWGSW